MKNKRNHQSKTDTTMWSSNSDKTEYMKANLKKVNSPMEFENNFDKTKNWKRMHSTKQVGSIQRESIWVASCFVGVMSISLYSWDRLLAPLSLIYFAHLFIEKKNEGINFRPTYPLVFRDFNHKNRTLAQKHTPLTNTIVGPSQSCITQH